jgi:hypothetical protein
MKGLKIILGTVARVVLYFNGHSHIGDVSFFGAVYIDGKRLSLFFKMARIWAKFILLVWVLL